MMLHASEAVRKVNMYGRPVPATPALPTTLFVTAQNATKKSKKKE
jgi:hypothetical protein